MTLSRLGHAVIVNNIASELPGSKLDVEALKDAYEIVGFDVPVHTRTALRRFVPRDEFLPLVEFI